MGVKYRSMLFRQPTLASTSPDHHLRPLDPRRDLMAVADIIEICFAASMDPDGREYLRQMREMARDEAYFSWTTHSYGGPLAMAGYVWEEESRVVGNLTLIPVYKQLQRVYLIANVAVLPEYRRNGIGRSLTQAALDHAHQHNALSAWLQVRAENTGAYELYRSLGFFERSRRTTWISERRSEARSSTPGINISTRRGSEWPVQKRWLQSAYPPDIAWNLPFSLNRLKPSLINDLYRFLLSETIGHWVARNRQDTLGFLTWEPSRTYADNLWLAAPPEKEEQAILSLIPEVRRRITTTRPLSLNYPAGRADQAFKDAGMTLQQTLVWMEKPFSVQPQVNDSRI